MEENQLGANSTVFIAGATGASGAPLVRQLLARGYGVIGLTRSPEKRAALERQGAQVVVADALDREALRDATQGLRADALVHALTAIPARGPSRPRDMEATNALRTVGTTNLLEIASNLGVRRVMAESMALGYGFGDWGERVLTEEQPFAVGRTATLEPTLAALRSLESQVVEATRIGSVEGVLLRFGYFYGPGASDTMVRMLKRRMFPLPGGGPGVGSWVTTEDAAAAVVAALERGEAGNAYNVVDDEPVALRDFLTKLASTVGAPKPWSVPQWVFTLSAPYAAAFLGSVLRVSNEKAKRDLDWIPANPTHREGIARIAASLSVDTPPGGSA